MENVHHHVAVVEQHPLPLGVAFGAVRTRSLLLERNLDPVRDGLYLAVRATGTHQQKICVGRQPPNIEEDQIFPTQLDLTFFYIPGTTSPRPIKIQNAFAEYNPGPPL